MRSIVALVALGGLSFFFRLGAVGLIGPDESRYAEVSRGMLERGDWVTPVLRGEPWLDKPPLYYWAAGASMWLLGETETAVRLPSAVAAFATCLAIAFIGNRLFGSSCGIRAALVLASSLGMVLYGRAAIMDSLLTLTLTIGLGAYLVHATVRPSRTWLAVAFAAFGAAVLAKGPIGILLPLIIIVLFQAASHRSLLPRASHLAISTLSFLAVVVPWHVAILHAQGWEFVEIFLLQHNVDRFLTTIHRHPGPIYYYLPILIVALVPWTVFVPAAVARSLRDRGVRHLFLLLWIGVPLVFFSLAGSKLPGYILPVLPPLALLVGLAWAQASRTEKEGAPWLRRSMGFHAALSVALGAAALYGFASRVPAVVEGGWFLAVLLVGLGMGAYLCGRQRPRLAFWSLVASSMTVTLALVLYIGPLMEPYKSLKTLATKGFVELEPEERLICYKCFYPQAHFYTRDRLGEIWTLEELRIRVVEWGRILMLTEPHRFRELVEDPSLRTHSIAECGGRILAEARPASPGSR
jgi:4-amino-4-deoxy-L-arabinose transferase-like glycosyltransferase